MIRARVLQMMLEAKKDLLQHPEKIFVPINVMGGQNDTLTSTQDNYVIFNKAVNIFRSQVYVEKARHFLFTDDKTKDFAMDSFSDWLRLAIYGMLEQFPQNNKQTN